MSRQFGYDLINKKLVPNEDAEIVRRIFRAYADGQGMRRIAQDLGNAGVRTKRGNPPDNRFIEYTLHNPVYIGKIRWSRDGRAASMRKYDSENVLLFDGNHEPLIDLDLWKKVQDMMKDEKKKYQKYQRREQPVGYMLKGLMRCSDCGATLCLALAKGPYPCLQCHNYARGSCKTSHSITVEKADKMVIDGLRQALGTLEFTIHPAKVEASTTEIDYDKLIRADEIMLQKAKDAYMAGIDTIEEYGENKRRIMNHIDELTAERNAQQKTDHIDQTDYAEKIVDVLRLLESDADPQAKNEALRTIIDKIVFDRKASKIEIFFYY